MSFASSKAWKGFSMYFFILGSVTIESYIMGENSLTWKKGREREGGRCGWEQPRERWNAGRRKGLDDGCTVPCHGSLQESLAPRH